MIDIYFWSLFTVFFSPIAFVMILMISLHLFTKLRRWVCAQHLFTKLRRWIYAPSRVCPCGRCISYRRYKRTQLQVTVLARQGIIDLNTGKCTELPPKLSLRTPDGRDYIIAYEGARLVPVKRTRIVHLDGSSHKAGDVCPVC